LYSLADLGQGSSSRGDGNSCAAWALPKQKNLWKRGKGGRTYVDSEVKALIDVLTAQARAQWKHKPVTHPKMCGQFFSRETADATGTTCSRPSWIASRAWRDTAAGPTVKVTWPAALTQQGPWRPRSRGTGI